MSGEDRRFYVYVIFRPNGVPCYVGKGTGGRWKAHVRSAQNPHLANIYAQAFGDLPIVKVAEELTGQEAIVLEIALIATIGREKNGGPLVNLTDGGEGTVGYKEPKSLEHRRKIGLANKGRILSPQTREAISVARKGQRRTKEAIAKSASAIRGRRRGPPSNVTRAKISAGNTGKHHSIETRAKMSAARRGVRKSPLHAEKIAAGLARWRQTPEGKETLSMIAKAKMASVEAREAASIRVSRYHSEMTPEEKSIRVARISEATKERMADPAIRAKISAARKKRANKAHK